MSHLSLQNTTNTHTTISFTFTRKARRGKRRSPPVLPYFSVLRRSSLSLGRRAIRMCGRRGARGCVARARAPLLFQGRSLLTVWHVVPCRTHAPAPAGQDGESCGFNDLLVHRGADMASALCWIRTACLLLIKKKKDTELLLMFAQL